MDKRKALFGLVSTPPQEQQPKSQTIPRDDDSDRNSSDEDDEPAYKPSGVRTRPA